MLDSNGILTNGCPTPLSGITEQKAGIDLKEWYETRTGAESHLPQFNEIIVDPETQIALLVTRPSVRALNF